MLPGRGRLDNVPQAPIDPARYQEFVDAFMQHGPNFARVSRRIGCSENAARAAWEKGWPNRDWAGPIREVYQGAIERMRQRLADLQPGSVASESQPRDVSIVNSGEETMRHSTVTDLLADSALKTVDTENKILQAQRNDILNSTRVGAKILGGLDSLADSVAVSLKVAAENPMTVNPKAVVGMLLDYSRAMVNLASASKTLMESQRLLWGAPQQIVETRGGSDAGAPDSQERLERAARTIDMLRRANLLPGDGGAAAPAPDPSEAYEGEESGGDFLLLPPAQKAG